MNAHRQVVLVGVDGSTSSLRAVALAVREATLRHLPLRIAHAFIWPLLDVPLGPAPGAPPSGGLRHHAEQIVTDAVAHAQHLAPDLDVNGEVLVGAPASTLLASDDAALIVLGDRGLDGFTGLLVGSVAVQVAHHATVPVLVARGSDQPREHVLVGVDGSPHANAAIGFAFDEAAYRGIALTALHAWQYPIPGDIGEMLPLVYDRHVLENEEARVLFEAMAGWQEKYPQVTVHHRLIWGSPRKVLVEASTRAELVVVGARGRGGFTGLVLGSVSQAVLHHADCPVAIVRNT